MLVFSFPACAGRIPEKVGYLQLAWLLDHDSTLMMGDTQLWQKRYHRGSLSLLSLSIVRVMHCDLTKNISNSLPAVCLFLIVM